MHKKRYQNSEEEENKRGLAKMKRHTFTKQGHLSNLLGVGVFYNKLGPREGRAISRFRG